jgi:flagellar basal body P-ring protein FlgI
MSDQNENTINEQNNIPGQQKEVNVKDYPYASELANLLKDIEYPTDKNKIINFIKSIGNTDENIMELIEKIEEDKQYNNSAEVINSTGLVG